MPTNKEELVIVNGYGAISANDESANKIFIVCFISVPYTLQEAVKSKINKLEYGDIVYNKIYTSHGRNKSRFYVYPYMKNVCLYQ